MIVMVMMMVMVVMMIICITDGAIFAFYLNQQNYWRAMEVSS